MKQKKTVPAYLRIFFSLVTCLVGLAAMAGFSYAEREMADENAAKAVEMLVMERTEAMNGYFAGDVQYLQASERLREMEAGELLEEDLEALHAWERTDIEIIEAFEILEVVLMELTEERIAAQVTVDWIVRGIEGKDHFSVTYQAVCEKQGETLKLVKFF